MNPALAVSGVTPPTHLPAGARTLRVAAVQTPAAESVPSGLARATPLVQHAAAEGAELVLLPELMAVRYVFTEEMWDSADCVAAYGRATPWFRNLIDDPAVEVLLPTRRFQGVATPVDPPGEWLAAYRALIASFGLVGRTVVGDIDRIDDAELLARHRVLPVVRIRPADGEPPVIPGAFDPGGRGWLIPWAATIAVLIVIGRRAGRGERRGVCAMRQTLARQ